MVKEMDEYAERDAKNRGDGKSSKEEKDTKSNPKVTGTKRKERWLLTRKTWRYMSDAGKKLFPEGANPHKKEDIHKFENCFQEVSDKCDEYILWDPIRKHCDGYEYPGSEDEGKDEATSEEQVNSLPGGNSQVAEGGRERLLSVGELGWGLPTEIYNHLLRSYGASTLHRVASKLLEEQLMEEDEFGYDEEEGELVEIDGRAMRSVGSQTEPYLDMCVQTDHDATAEDFVKVGAETRAETEAAYERALLQERLSKGENLSHLKAISPLYQQPITSQQQLQIKHSESQVESSQQLSESFLRAQLHAQELHMQQPAHQQFGPDQQHNQSHIQHVLPQQALQNQQGLQPHLISQHHGTLPQHQLAQQSQDNQGLPQQHSQPPVLKKFWARRESLTAKADAQQQTHVIQPHEKGNRGIAVEKVNRGMTTEKDSKESPTPTPKGGVAARLASLEAGSLSGPGAPNIAPKQEQSKQQEKKKQNVFKLGLKCDVEGQQGFNRVSVEKQAMDRFKTVNYDKTLRNIKSKWVPTPEEEEYIRALERENELERERLKELKLKEKERVRKKEREERLQEKKEKEREAMKEKERIKEKEKTKDKEKEKKKKKARGIQVGDPLPQFILNSFRINSPVEIIHATRRRFRRFSSKADSNSGSESSMPPSGMISPRLSITILDEQGNRDLMVSEDEAYKLSQMGIPFVYKRPSLDPQLGMSDLESGYRDSPHVGGMSALHHFQRSLSAAHASGHLAQMFNNLRSGRLGGGGGGGGGSYVGGRANDRAQRLTQSLLHYLLPTVMQRPRGSGGGHASRLVAKRIWRTRSKSQSRASAGTTSIWTPMGNSTWMSVTGRASSLEATSLLHLSEMERLTLQRLSLAKLQALNLGCQIKIPKESSSSTPNKKRRPYLLKRKARSTGFFDAKKEENKGASGGLVFGLSLNKCLENERLKFRETSEREALAMAAAMTPSGEEGEGSLSRKSSQAGSHASFTSLLEGTKHSTTGSLESLNLERKRPSLGGGDILAGGSPTSLDMLMVDPQPLVPSLVSTCCKFLETHGLHTLGIFRVSSSKKRVRQLREEFDTGKDVTLTEEHCPHDVATLLKEFFRDLPEPLLTRELYEALLCTQKN